MNDQAVHPARVEDVEAILRSELARGDAMAESLLPVLRHLVLGEDSSSLTEDIVFRVRGMIASLAGELCHSLKTGDPVRDDDEAQRVGRALVDNPSLLAHLHSVAFEWHLTERLQAALGIDPVWTPLLQAAVASAGTAVRADAMAFLSAQAGWCQSQRRMTMAVGDLPAEVVHEVLLILRDCPQDLRDRAVRAEDALRKGYDEGSTRLSLAARLLTGMGPSDQSLSAGHAGIALFLSALSLKTGLMRERIVACCHDGQVAQLMMVLSAAGLSSSSASEVILSIHPGGGSPEFLDLVARDLAQSHAVSKSDPPGSGPGPEGAGA